MTHQVTGQLASDGQQGDDSSRLPLPATTDSTPGHKPNCICVQCENNSGTDSTELWLDDILEALVWHNQNDSDLVYKNKSAAKQAILSKLTALQPPVSPVSSGELDAWIEKLVQDHDLGWRFINQPQSVFDDFKADLRLRLTALEQEARLEALKVARHDVDFAKRWKLDYDEILANMEERIRTLTQVSGLIGAERLSKDSPSNKPTAALKGEKT